MRVLIALLLSMWLSSSALAEPSETDRSAIRSVIENQIAAFNADDGKKAFSFASPKIQFMFRTPDNFMNMVRRGYPLIYRAAKVSFLTLAETDEGLIQKVLVTGRNGSLAVARYRMEKRGDRWLINGCMLDKAGAA